MDNLVLVSNPVAVLTDAKSYSEFYERVKAEVSAHVPDVSSERGRKEIASLAYKVTRSKTAIDDAGKKLNEEARAKINAVDAQRRKIREELEALATDVRKPLTEWEEAEDKRKEVVAGDLAKIASLKIVLASDTAADIKAKWEQLNALIFHQDDHKDGLDHAIAMRDAALDALEQAQARAQRHEDDQRELARLRAEQEARQREEREAKQKAEADRLEQERAAKIVAEQKAREERIADEARKASEQAAQVQRDRIEREAREAIAKAEAEAKAVKDKAEREERERLAVIERERKEQEAREADRAHRSRILGEAKAAVMSHGPEEAVAKAIVLAIVANEIPHVSLRF